MEGSGYQSGKIYNNKLLKCRVDNKALYEAILSVLKSYYYEIEEETNLHTFQRRYYHKSIALLSCFP